MLNTWQRRDPPWPIYDRADPPDGPIARSMSVPRRLHGPLSWIRYRMLLSRLNNEPATALPEAMAGTAVRASARQRPVLRVATYNVHRCRGLDRRVLPQRIAQVLKPLDADIIALQEVIGPGPRRSAQDEELATALGMYWAMAPTRLLRGHLYGNVVLSRFPILHHSQHDLSLRWRTPRCCQRVDLEIDHRILHVYNVHLGTGIGERRHQAARLADFVNGHALPGPRIVLGDFNEWGRGLAAKELTPHFNSLDLRAYLKRRRTYPGFFPVLHLDHIFYDESIDVLHLQVPRTRFSLIASDHLPLVADLHVNF